jgi:hypothetical protein
LKELHTQYPAMAAHARPVMPRRTDSLQAQDQDQTQP